MPSPLLVNSEGFRKKLLTRNLVPYAKSPNRPTPPIDYEAVQSDLSIVDSPDQLIDEPIFADKLYPLNQWGSDGGYKQVPDPTGLLNSHSNEGEYGFQDANLVDEGYDAPRYWRPLNAYADTTKILDSADAFGTLDIVYPNGGRGPNGQPYPTFNYSSYGPASILLTNDPIGSNGLMSEDSFLARIGAKSLKKDFEDRIGREIIRNTVGRANLFNVTSGTNVLGMATGRIPLIEPNYTITVAADPIIAATDFALRLAGSTIPVSTIPGSYFDTSINPGQPTTIQQLQNAFRKSNVNAGNFFSRLLGADKTGSQIFLNNTGAGQKSRLFGNIDYNKYKPYYQRTILDRLGGALVGTTTDNSNFYVGSQTSDPSRVFSPGGDLPVNQFGQEVQSPVYGPQELAQLYEGPSKDVRLGANGPIYSDGGGIEGGLTWVSPKYKGNAGKKVGVDGKITNQSNNSKPSSYDSTESTNITFTEGSILQDTQRIIDSQPSGGRRLQHVGNAIDQVSKVFNDGYKELTKGSRVLSYVGSIGNEVGTEYCRVFAKDVPYLQYNTLQKTDGMTTEGRKFSYSVLDKTYNLNIAPNRQEGGQDSSNLIGTTNNAVAKKYMFSIENLAWRTSSAPGYSVSDLPICERGPNGGRVMWFPPYGLTFSENVSTGWQSTDFIGRPEPVYTYKNTSRGGSIQWKIVVDHPSVLNLIVNKVLSNETNKTRINQMIDSFFAGCLKYDLYELAKKYYTINPNDLQQLQEAISSKKLTKEQLQTSVQTIQTGVDSTDSVDQQITTSTTDDQTAINSDEYTQLGFYFDNDIPKGSVSPYGDYYTAYVNSKSSYVKNSPTVTTPYASSPQQVDTFFSSIIEGNFTKLKELADKMVKLLSSNKEATISLSLIGTASPPAQVSYNASLSDRRLESVTKWFLDYNPVLKDAYSSTPVRRFTIISSSRGEEDFVSTKDASGSIGERYNCASSGFTSTKQTRNQLIYTVNAMACRRVAISNITYKNPVTVQKSTDVTQSIQSPRYGDVLVKSKVPVTVTEQTVERTWVQRDNITKRVLRSLLSECDYFETIKQETPMVYDNLKEKLKFFQPAFHSTTPEGLNGRLTFLQQCMRPGETIPTVKSVDGKPVLEYNNAVNTSFGAPPVLVLRIGDFYNTKIIPEGLQFQYENLDINPEGIGIQPMIANVTLSFKFVGGSGLKTAVDKLQNALSFNYYANTEIYDDRADVTDDSYKVLDKKFLNDIGFQVGPPTPNQIQNNTAQSNQNTIGTIVTSIPSNTGETGTISYKSFMDSFTEQTQNYFINFINKSKECTKQYNNAIRQNWTASRLYTVGNLLSSDSEPVYLIGKPNLDSRQNGFVYRINKVTNQLVKDIGDENDLFIKFISSKQNNFSNKIIRQLKTNYINFIKNKSSEYQNAITQLTQSLTYSEQTYIGYLSKENVLLYSAETDQGTDGYQNQQNNVTIFNISGTTEVYNEDDGNTWNELNQDLLKIQNSLKDYDDIISVKQSFNYNSKEYTNGILLYGDAAEYATANDLEENVFFPFSYNTNFDNASFRRMYMLLSSDIVDSKKYETFKASLIDNIITNSSLSDTAQSSKLQKEFDNYWLLTAKPAFVDENEITIAFIDNLEKGKLKDFVKYTPFPSKERVFTYEKSETPNNNQVSLIKSLNTATGGGNQNSNTKTWNDPLTAGVYISKLKLN